MVNYRRNHQPNATYFFTHNLKHRHQTHLTDHIDLLRTSFKKTQKKYPSKIHGIVILPNHLHILMTFKQPNFQYPKYWQYLKSHWTKSLIKNGIKIKKNKHGEYQLWQRRYWEHTIQDEDDFNIHLNYIHTNPIKHKHSLTAQDWKFSSYHKLSNPKENKSLKPTTDINFGEQF